MHIRNGIPAPGLSDQGWARPRSGNGRDRLEAARHPGGRVALRQGTGPGGPAGNPLT
jgi:hypothetical protein